MTYELVGGRFDEQWIYLEHPFPKVYVWENVISLLSTSAHPTYDPRHDVEWYWLNGDKYLWGGHIAAKRPDSPDSVVIGYRQTSRGDGIAFGRSSEVKKDE